MTPGAKLIALYQTRGCEQQALEIARSMGGEYWRLLWAFHRASETVDEIHDLLLKIESLYRYGAPPSGPHEGLSLWRWRALCIFLHEGIRYWDEDRAFPILQQLERI